MASCEPPAIHEVSDAPQPEMFRLSERQWRNAAADLTGVYFTGELPDIDFTFPDVGDLIAFDNIEFDFDAILDALLALSDFLGEFDVSQDLDPRAVGRDGLERRWKDHPAVSHPGRRPAPLADLPGGRQPDDAPGPVAQLPGAGRA